MEETKKPDTKKLTPEELKKAKEEADLKYMIEGVKHMKEREFEILPDSVKDSINQFVNIAIKNNMTAEEVVACVRFMPANQAEQICDRLKYAVDGDIDYEYEENLPETAEKNPYRSIDSKLCKMYAEDFIKACDKSKDGTPKVLSITAYRQLYKRNKEKRFLSYYELFMILNGMHISTAPLILQSAKQPDDKYYKIVKALHTERWNVKYRNSEYRMLCDLHQDFVNDALNIQSDILAKRNTINV